VNGADCLDGLALELAVHVAQQLVTDDHVGRQGDQRDRYADGSGRDQPDPGPEADALGPGHGAPA
jgi:hypothetical protein